MKKRREFLKKGAFGAMALGSLSSMLACATDQEGNVSNEEPLLNKPLVISTWDFGQKANAEAWKVLGSNGSALDAVESGVKVIEADPENTTVGIGGAPDRDGFVTLDACIMDHTGACGSVAFLQHIMHPISVARKVMESTPHIMLVGDGALKFALENGFEKTNLLTEKSKKAWERWLERGIYKPKINVENHDTIGMIALDASGHLAGACTTSGAAYKMHGRVGDSPLIGAGLYVEEGVGAATATGLGEAVIRTVGSAMVVELMRQGLKPEAACKALIERIIKRFPGFEEIQVGFIAVNQQGEVGAYAIQPGFTYSVQDKNGSRVLEAGSRHKAG